MSLLRAERGAGWEAGFGSGHTPHTRTPGPYCLQLTQSAVIYLPTGISGVVHYSLEAPTSLVKMLCSLQKAQLLPVDHTFHCKTSKMIPKARFTMKDATASAS